MEAHNSPFSMHPGGTKMYQDLKHWWKLTTHHFTSAFWHRLQKALGTRLDFSTAFHPQTDGQTECLNQILEDMLRACVLDFKESWDSKLHLMEFSYNNSLQEFETFEDESSF